MVRALALCAAAYERVGLLWASRGALLHAASIATNEWWTHSEITPAQLTCYSRLKWVELQLGRVPQLLAWHELDQAARAIGQVDAQPTDRQSAAEVQFDVMVGILLLRLDLWQLREVERLPTALEKLGLGAPTVALDFALGYFDDVPADIGFGSGRG